MAAFGPCAALHTSTGKGRIRMSDTRHPLSAVIEACAPLRFAPLPALSTSELQTGPQEAPEYWLRADLLAADGALGAVYDKATAAHGPDHRLPSVVHFQRSLMRDPLFLVAAGLYLTDRAPLVRRDHLWYPWHRGAELGTPLLTDVAVAVLPGDGTAGHPAAVPVAGPHEQERMAAEHLVAAFTPLITALHQHTRMGVRTLWGWVVDCLGFYMLNPARFLGHDAEQAWERSRRLIDAVAEAGASFRTRPRLFPFAPAHPRGTWAVRGTCCFDYKCADDGAYCLTCPLRDDASRLHTLQTWLQDPAGAA
jgi:hypothetical protein